MHFFNPVPVLPLVELVPVLLTAPETVQRAEAFADRGAGQDVDPSQGPGRVRGQRAADPVPAGRDPDGRVRVRHAPRTSTPAMVAGCAHPMGPLRAGRPDRPGHHAAVAESMYEEFKEPLYAPPPLLLRMVEAGLLGRKSGQGFFSYGSLTCAPPSSARRSATRCPPCCTPRPTRRSGWPTGRTRPIDCGEPELAGFVAGLGPEWAGLSLTMPLKRATLEVADEVDALAAAIGAANTLVLAGGAPRYNTDMAGIAATLREAGTCRVARSCSARAAPPSRAGRAGEAGLDDGGGAGARPGRAGRAARPPPTGSASRSTCVPGCPVRGAEADLVVSTLPAGGGGRAGAAGRSGAARRGLRALADAVRGRRGRRRRHGGQRAGDAAAPGRRAGRADDRPDRAGAGDAGRAGCRGSSAIGEATGTDHTLGSQERTEGRR